MSEDNFFAMPADDAAPPADNSGEGDFTMVGDAPPSEAPPAAPVEDDGDMMGFAGAPAAEEEAPADAFASPPEETEDTPIILGGPPPEEPEIAMDDPAPAEPELPPAPAEPSIMQKWNEEWQVTLTQRKDEENSKKAEMIESARAYLEKFQADKEAKREAKMAKNREDEQAKLEAIEADLENDNSWQRVCKMVELSHDGAHEGEDVKRMRDVLILLKNEPARASAVGA
mmetsp:Transcript_101502/g.293728  ORF Transcript_101502/g.293728 Transcript_101502/m.293728 type:complete len:228 (-) Transcript_101502:87-770(-)|eukprot:CAMPEP_0176060606 /NCGR_PEP_ID=MMETSP0120_2-20121206/30209_1 /TAXON_ID=160619 /ORGANISM="Kryptoperidinium foliaceum, Strain CCMP 1326" /LENGTH=227 /DNA_ID=CAMNT_0017394151 /DNA_START=47 /DNA_END=730 /DNA_ORIENTATION=+